MRIIWLSLCLCYASAVCAAVDLEKTMKNMAFQYKLAYDTENTTDLLPLLEQLIGLTELALQAEFTADKAAQFKQGLQQVQTELQAARSAAQQNDVSLAKSHLRQVDKLRKEYHQQRKVSIWQLLFG
ncbi:MAG TPA: cytochrome b562 [Rheinheimera sp.]|nr:cytochrome b562 [Rheinheimera sp.]